MPSFSTQVANAEEATVEELWQLGQSHWAFQPFAKPTESKLDSPELGVSAEIDRHVDARRQEAGVVPLAQADRRTLVRRLYFHLIGLPPTPAEIAAVLNDASADPIAALVDELLARPEFGERWGRHWLDVARYADSNGCSIEANNTYDNAWRYRDYVIASLNEDKRFDQFVL